MIERGQPCGCSDAIPLRKGFERQVELRDQPQLRRDAAKMDNPRPDRQRRQELRPPQGLGLVRQSREAAVHSVFPIVWWRLHGGYDFLEETIHAKPGQADLFKSLNETSDPQQQVFLRSSMDLPCQTELDIEARWIDTVHNNNGGTPGTVPSYAEMDVRLAWHPTKNLEFSIVGQNLLHDQHAEAGFPGTAQEQIQRSIYGKISCQF